MTPLLDRRGAETDEQSESGEAGWWILPYFVIQKINSTTPYSMVKNKYF